MALNFKLETGIQLLSRLTKKASLENFYPSLFGCGPKHGEIIEVFSSSSPNFLVNDLITEALIPQEFGGVESGVIIFITDGNFVNNSFIDTLKVKLQKHLANKKGSRFNKERIDALLESTLKNLHLIYLYDSTQFYITIQNLGSILVKHPNISLLVFYTLTAFYWSEQDFKVIKMDVYIKNLIKIVQRALKDFKVVVLYAKPQYFSSSKEVLENLEPCCRNPTDERINYRIQISLSDGGSNFVNVQSCDNLITKEFQLNNGQINWK